MGALDEGMKASVDAAKEVVNAYKKGLLSHGKLHEYVYDNILAGLNAQRIAGLLCEYHSLFTHVEQMRKAQKALENAPRETRYDLENIETLFMEAQELEKKVDRLIHNIRIDIASK